MANEIVFDIDYSSGVPVITFDNGLKVLIRTGVDYSFWTSRDKKIADYYDVKESDFDKKKIKGDLPFAQNTMLKEAYVTDIAIKELVFKDVIVLDTSAYKTDDYDLVIGMIAFNSGADSLGINSGEQKLTIGWE